MLTLLGMAEHWTQLLNWSPPKNLVWRNAVISIITCNTEVSRREVAGTVLGFFLFCNFFFRNKSSEIETERDNNVLWVGDIVVMTCSSVAVWLGFVVANIYVTVFRSSKYMTSSPRRCRSFSRSVDLPFLLSDTPAAESYTSVCFLALQL